MISLISIIDKLEVFYKEIKKTYYKKILMNSKEFSLTIEGYRKRKKDNSYGSIR